MTYALIAAAMATGGAAAADTAAFTGSFIGTGRACYGTLAVRAKTMSWLTAFRQCRSVPYKTVERSENAGTLRLTYRFEHVPQSCQYRVVSVTHNTAAGADAGWQVTGYASGPSYIDDKARAYAAKDGAIMSCYLVRVPEKNQERGPPGD